MGGVIEEKSSTVTIFLPVTFKRINMFKKFFVFLVVVNCSVVIFAQSDYSAQWKAAYKLYTTRKYDEAMDAFVKLAENTSSAGNKYNCYCYAGYSARKLKKYDEAIAFADKIGEIYNPYKYMSLIRKEDFMYSAGKYKDIIDTFTLDDILKWPQCYRSEGLYYVGLAQYNLKNGEEAEKTFKQMQDSAESEYWKGLGLLRSAHNYRYRLKDADKAAETYNATIESGAHPNHKSEAYVGLAGLLISQKKYDEALAEYDKLIAMKKVAAYWKSRGLYAKGNLLKTMGKNEAAIKCYKDAIATKGCADWVKNGCQKQLKALEPKTE